MRRSPPGRSRKLLTATVPTSTFVQSSNWLQQGEANTGIPPPLPEMRNFREAECFPVAAASVSAPAAIEDSVLESVRSCKV